MKKVIHYIFIIISIFLLGIITIPGFLFYYFTRINVTEKFYLFCHKFEKKYFSDENI